MSTVSLTDCQSYLMVRYNNFHLIYLVCLLFDICIWIGVFGIWIMGHDRCQQYHQQIVKVILWIFCVYVAFLYIAMAILCLQGSKTQAR